MNLKYLEMKKLQAYHNAWIEGYEKEFFKFTLPTPIYVARKEVDHRTTKGAKGE